MRLDFKPKIMTDTKRIQVKSLDDLDKVLNVCRSYYDEKGQCNVDVFYASEDKPKKKRSISQNASLHKYCSNISTRMTDAGFTQRLLVGKFREGFELPVTQSMIKDIFREVGKAMFKKESTKDLTTIEIQRVYQVVDERFGNITGIREEWPCADSQISKGLR